MEKRFSRGFGMGILVAVGTLLGGCATEMQEDVESDEDAVRISFTRSFKVVRTTVTSDLPPGMCSPGLVDLEVNVMGSGSIRGTYCGIGLKLKKVDRDLTKDELADARAVLLKVRKGKATACALGAGSVKVDIVRTYGTEKLIDESSAACKGADPARAAGTNTKELAETTVAIAKGETSASVFDDEVTKIVLNARGGAWELMKPGDKCRMSEMSFTLDIATSKIEKQICQDTTPKTRATIETTLTPLAMVKITSKLKSLETLSQGSCVMDVPVTTLAVSRGKEVSNYIDSFSGCKSTPVLDRKALSELRELLLSP